MQAHSLHLWIASAVAGSALTAAALVVSAPLDETPVQEISAQKTAFGFAQTEPITPIPLNLRADPAKVALWRSLFNDSRLSRDNSSSCAHGHTLKLRGADGLPRSSGVGGAEGEINSLTLFNSGFISRLFWDGRAASLELQVEHPITNVAELGSNWPQVLSKVDAYATRLMSSCPSMDVQRTVVGSRTPSRPSSAPSSRPAANSTAFYATNKAFCPPPNSRVTNCSRVWVASPAIKA